jgi:hypothetical protein
MLRAERVGRWLGADGLCFQVGGAYRGFRKPLDRVFPLELINFGDVRRRSNAATKRRNNATSALMPWCNEVQRCNTGGAAVASPRGASGRNERHAMHSEGADFGGEAGRPRQRGTHLRHKG